jgi:hypothetical protein
MHDAVQGRDRTVRSPASTVSDGEAHDNMIDYFTERLPGVVSIWAPKRSSIHESVVRRLPGTLGVPEPSWPFSGDEDFHLGPHRLSNASEQALPRRGVRARPRTAAVGLKAGATHLRSTSRITPVSLKICRGRSRPSTRWWRA